MIKSGCWNAQDEGGEVDLSQNLINTPDKQGIAPYQYGIVSNSFKIFSNDHSENNSFESIGEISNLKEVLRGAQRR